MITNQSPSWKILFAQADGSCTSEDCEVSLRQLRAEKLKAIEKEALGFGGVGLLELSLCLAKKEFLG